MKSPGSAGARCAARPPPSAPSRSSQDFCALTKILLAGLSEERRAAILDARLPAVAPRTATDRDQLLHELERARVAGYALSLEELAEGLTSAAAPVRDHTGTVVAAISAAGPSFRFTGRHLDDCIARVKEAAMAASRELGYRVSAAS